MKISIIGAGNVGSTTAMRLAQENLGEIVLVDIVKGLAQGKAFDLEDARQILKIQYQIEGSEDINKIKASNIVVITAGLTRKPGMTREELLRKNAQILKDTCLNIKKLATEAIVVVVTNPLDLLTYLALKTTGFAPNRVIGMGPSLDAARFANLISRQLNISAADIEPCVIGSHGEGMLPLPRLTKVQGVALDELLDDNAVKALVEKTVGRGLEIVTLLGSGSAYFAPSAATASLVKSVAKDEKRVIGVCAYLSGEYGIKDTCIGVPCRIGSKGIEQVIELELNPEEQKLLQQAAEKLKVQYQNIL
ncbi:MAG: malate dehydrogenase [Candidatus Omnitrophota bacterium]|nr:malate dehydrogenase [Candidatus Omnitrophota bacterium]